MKKTTQNVIVGTFITAILASGCIILGVQDNHQSSSNRPESSTQTENREKFINHADSEKTVTESKPVVENKTETSTRPIPYETKYVDDNSLPKGQTKTTTYGVNGVETTTYEVTYTNGVETSRKVISITTTKQPVTEVISRGTYVAPKPQPAQQNCNIKGNISYKTGEKIYHVPGQRHYNETVINTSKGERWFCSEAEARAAGWRKSKV